MRVLLANPNERDRPHRRGRAAGRVGGHLAPIQSPCITRQCPVSGRSLRFRDAGRAPSAVSHSLASRTDGRIDSSFSGRRVDRRVRAIAEPVDKESDHAPCLFGPVTIGGHA